MGAPNRELSTWVYCADIAVTHTAKVQVAARLHGFWETVGTVSPQEARDLAAVFIAAANTVERAATDG
jgi:hypothetical protein